MLTCLVACVANAAFGLQILDGGIKFLKLYRTHQRIAHSALLDQPRTRQMQKMVRQSRARYSYLLIEFRPPSARHLQLPPKF